MKNLFKTFLVFAALLLSTFIFSDDNYVQAESKIKKTVVFKNGLGFYMRELKSKSAADKLETAVISNVVLGTLWISASGGAEIKKITAQNASSDKKIPAADFADLIKVNKGKKVKINYYGNVIYDGIISDLKPDPENDAANIKPSMLYLDNGKQIIVLYIGNIISIEFLDKNFNSMINNPGFEKKLLIDLSAKSSSPVYISYIQRGISWTPSYLIDISASDFAILSMKAIIINDSDDLLDCDVDLAAGYPNFMYQSSDSPMTLSTSLNAFMSSIGSSYPAAAPMSNIAYQSRAIAESAEEDFMQIPDANVNVSSSEDLHLFNFKNVNLKKGERAYYDVFSKKFKYEHLYTWDIPETATVSSSGYYQSMNDQKTEQVWHVIRIENSGTVPWTTAPAFTVKNNKPVAQDTMNYTPAGTDSRVKLTVSSDVKIDRREEEKGRDRKVKIGSSLDTFDHILIEGELYVKNTKNEKITLEINKKLTGEVIDAELKPQIVKEAEGLNSVNFKTAVKWSISLNKGETKKIKYSYKIYVKN